MEYVKLGRTGLDVSRICLGCMSYGEPSTAAGSRWSLDEEREPALLPPGRSSSGINFFDTANIYSIGAERGDHRPGPARATPGARQVVLATKVHGRMRDGPNGAGPLPQGHPGEIEASLRRLGDRLRRPVPDPPLGPADADRGDAGGPARRGEGGQGRATSARSSMYAWQFAKALYLADRHGWTRFVSMQNHYNLLYREEEREMMPLCADRGHRRHPVEPAGPRTAHPRLGRGHAPLRPDQFGRSLYAQTGRPTARSSTGSARSPRGAAFRGPRGARVDAGQARRDCADHRRDQAAPPRRRGGGGRAGADRGRGGGARGAVHPAPGGRLLLNCTPVRWGGWRRSLRAWLTHPTRSAGEG